MGYCFRNLGWGCEHKFQDSVIWPGLLAHLTSRLEAPNSQQFLCHSLLLLVLIGGSRAATQSSLEWGDFMFVCPFVRTSIPPSGHIARHKVHLARPEAGPTRPKGQPASQACASDLALVWMAWPSWLDLQRNIQMDKRTENLAILQDFVP